MQWVKRHAWLIVTLFLGLCAVFLIVPIGMRLAVGPHIYLSVDDVPKAQIAIVLGASVVGGEPSPILAARADGAIALYNAGKVSKILVTGDNGALTHDEVTPVRKYLLAADIPAEDIFLDHAGFDTYSSMYRANYIFGATSAVIATQDFHLPRALWIARALGIDASGLEVQGGENSPYDYLREIPASFKALWDVATHRTPKYLGAPIPLSGNGESTWY